MRTDYTGGSSGGGGDGDVGGDGDGKKEDISPSHSLCLSFRISFRQSRDHERPLNPNDGKQVKCRARAQVVAD